MCGGRRTALFLSCPARSFCVLPIGLLFFGGLQCVRACVVRVCARTNDPLTHHCHPLTSLHSPCGDIQVLMEYPPSWPYAAPFIQGYTSGEGGFQSCKQPLKHPLKRTSFFVCCSCIVHLPVSLGAVLFLNTATHARAHTCIWIHSFKHAQAHTHTTGGRPGPVLVCDDPPPWVLRDNGVGAMAPTAPKFFCACFPFIKPSMF